MGDRDEYLEMIDAAHAERSRARLKTFVIDRAYAGDQRAREIIAESVESGDHGWPDDLKPAHARRGVGTLPDRMGRGGMGGHMANEVDVRSFDILAPFKALACAVLRAFLAPKITSPASLWQIMGIKPNSAEYRAWRAWANVPQNAEYLRAGLTAVRDNGCDAINSVKL
jgi:hypothetical protein